MINTSSDVDSTHVVEKESQDVRWLKCKHNISYIVHTSVSLCMKQTSWSLMYTFL